MAARHRARSGSIQIMKVAIVPANKCRRPHVTNLHVSNRFHTQKLDNNYYFTCHTGIQAEDVLHANIFTITSTTSEEELEYDSTGNEYYLSPFPSLKYYNVALLCPIILPTCTVQHRWSELEMQRKGRVKVHIVTTWPACACAVNLCCVVATREPAAAYLSNLVLTLEVKQTQGKCSINRGRD